MNHHALACLTPDDHTIVQIIAALKKVHGWKGKTTDASWIKARLGTLKPPTITHGMLNTACNIYGSIVSIGLPNETISWSSFNYSASVERVFSGVGLTFADLRKTMKDSTLKSIFLDQIQLVKFMHAAAACVIACIEICVYIYI